MSTRYTIEGSTLQGIANAIRTKNGSAEEYTPAEMIDAINALDLESGGVDPDALELTVDEDGLAEVVLEGEVIKSKQIDSSVDEDLVAENIREGKNIFGVDGSMPALQENYEVVGGTFEPADYIEQCKFTIFI